VQLATGPTAAVFTWNGDRWTHRLTIGEATSWMSLDGPCPPANDPRWPASPVLVELSTVSVPRARVSVPRGDAAVGQAIVGVGLAGRSYFSASIASDPHDAGVIRFEIACRLHEPPGWIGSTYRQGDRLFRLTPLDDLTTLPRTVVWAYSIGPTGMTSVSGAAVSTSPA
jgi:hypothetical protein